MTSYDASIWKEPAAASFLLAASSVSGKAEAQAFLADVLTEKEILEFGNRVRAAEMLRRGETYMNVQAVTGLSSTTVARVSDWLQRGPGGYNRILNRISNKLTQHLHQHITHAGSVSVS